MHKLKSSENENNNHQKEFYEILLNNIDSSEFNIFNYNEEIKCNLINILIDELYPSEKYLYDDEKKTHNKKAKIILEKIIEPIIDINLKESEQKDKNDKYMSMINTLLCQKERMKRVFISDISAIFDKSNVEKFYIIFKNILNNYISKNNNNADSNQEETSLYYVYQLLYEMALKEKKIIVKMINQSFISELLGKLTSENKKNKNVIYDIVMLLLKNLDDYNDILFDVEKKEKTNVYFHEKHYLIRNISPIFIELLFNEKVELLIILLKLLQYNEPKFSKEFNSKSLFDLFEYSTKKNKISDMNKVLFGLLGINDKYIFGRLNYLLGYPTLIIKDIKYDDVKNAQKDKEKDKNLINGLYDEEEKENVIKENKEEIKNKYKWPLFGERLISEKGDIEYKLHRNIFKYISYYHERDDYCLLSRLMPEIDENGQIVNEENKSITDKERKDLIYDFLKLMLVGKGNYNIFKYIYLSPSRCILYNNLFEEMLDILEQENKKEKNNIYNLEEIKTNAGICSEKINNEVSLMLKYLTESDIIRNIMFKLMILINLLEVILI